MKIAIVGSRNFRELLMVQSYVNFFVWKDDCVITGGARGVDQMAERAAYLKGLDVMLFKANWEKWGKRAGYIRNEEMIKHADKVVAFWDGVSKGTKHMIELAKKYEIPCQVIR